MLNNYEIEAASEELESMPFYPSTPGGKLAVMKVLRSMVTTKQQLDWLTFTMVNRVGKWKGCAEMRGVFCTRFKPADGIEMNCVESIGFTAEDGEAQYQQIQTAERAQLGPSPARLMIEGHISPEDAAESERARLATFEAIGRVKSMPEAPRPQPRRVITEADFEILRRKA